MSTTHNAHTVLIPVCKIEFLWNEGKPIAQYDTIKKSFSEANAVLRKVAQNNSLRPGYDKVAFRVTWEDGTPYEGRCDIHHIEERQETTSGLVDLAEHIRDYITFIAGERRPRHMTEKEYQELLRMYVKTAPTLMEDARIFLGKYQLS